MPPSELDNPYASPPGEESDSIGAGDESPDCAEWIIIIRLVKHARLWMACVAAILTLVCGGAVFFLMFDLVQSYASTETAVIKFLLLLILLLLVSGGVCVLYLRWRCAQFVAHPSSDRLIDLIRVQNVWWGIVTVAAMLFTGICLYRQVQTFQTSNLETKRPHAEREEYNYTRTSALSGARVP